MVGIGYHSLWKFTVFFEPNTFCTGEDSTGRWPRNRSRRICRPVRIPSVHITVDPYYLYVNNFCPAFPCAFCVEKAQNLSLIDTTS